MAKMLETCRNHIAIADNLNAMGLRSKTVNAVNKWEQKTSVSIPKTSTENIGNPRTNMHVGIAQNSMHLAEPPALPRTPHANHVAKLVIEMRDAEAPPVDRRIQTKKPPRCGPNGGKQKQTHSVDVGNDYDPQCDEVSVNATAITIDALTEAWATVTIPAEIGPNHCGSL